MTDFWAAIGKQGFAIVALVVLAYGCWKFFIDHLWPLLTKQLEDSGERLDAQVEKSEKRLDDATKAFLDELKQQREVTQEGFDALSRLIADRIDRTDARIDRLDRPIK